MSLRFIVGKSGSGKTTNCFKEIIESSQNGNSSIIYIVPEQFSIQSEKNLLEKLGVDAIMKIHVLSFKRLAYYVFSETGFKAGKILEDTGKFILIRKIIDEVKHEFKYYENPNITKGFIEKISETITEFYEYNISIKELLENSSQNERLMLKIKDLELIYNRFLKYLAENYISTDETLDILAGNIYKSNFLNNAEIWIDEFSSFTPQEINVIKALLEKACKVNIAITADCMPKNYNDISKTDIFYTTKETIKKLSILSENIGIKIETPKYLNTLHRYKKSNELKFLEENYFNYSSNTYKEKNKKIKTFAAKNRYEEVIFLANYITHLVRENGYKYSDIAVITSDISLYENIIRPVFNLYDFSFFIDSNTDVLSNPFVEAIRALLDIYIKNWSFESIIRFLRTNITNIPTEEIDIFENYIVSYGIKGYKWQQKEWYYGFKNENNIFDYEKIHDIKNKIQNILDNFNAGIKFKEVLSVKEISFKIYNFLEKIDITDKLNILYNEALLDKNDILAKQHLQIWDIVKSLFEKFVEIMGNVKMSIKEFSEILDAGFFSLNMGNIPSTQDRIIIGDLVRTRLSNIKSIFILGANEGLFPEIRKEKGIFTDDERRLINETGLEIAPDIKSGIFFDNFTLYSALTKPENMLTISIPLSDINGKELFISSAVQRINKLFPDSQITDTKAIEISSPNAVFEKVIENFSKNNFSNELLSWFTNNQEYLDKINKYTNLNKCESISEDTIKGLYSENIKTSISRLEKYISCPFAFFVRYNLQAIERQTYKIKNVDLGNLFHDVLEEFSIFMSKNNLLWGNLSEEEINSYTEKAFDIVVKEMESDLFLSDEKNAYVLTRALRIAKRSIWALSEHIKRGEFKPFGAEIDFGIKSPITGITIEINENHKFTITGRIDRIDIFDNEGKSYIKILDYKSGNKKFDLTDVYYGMQIQLLIYMKSILENGKKTINTNYELMPGGILYFKIHDPIIDTSKRKQSEIKDLILKEFKMSGLVNSCENIISAMDNKPSKTSDIIPGKNYALDYKAFLQTLEYATEKVKKTGEEIISGKISPKPFKKGSLTGCDYCNYNSICGFDTQSKDSLKYNIFRKRSCL